MAFGTLHAVLCCLASLLLSGVKGQDFRESPPNTDGWLNPDDVFAVSQSQIHTSGESPSRKSSEISMVIKEREKEGGEKKDGECEERLKQLINKYSYCQKSSSVVNQCSNESSGENTYLKRFIQKLLEVSALNTGDVQSTNVIDLKLYVSGDQLMTLRQFATAGGSKSIPLRKLDEIFTSVFVKPYITLPSLGSLSNMMANFKIGSFHISIVLPAVWFSCILIWTRNVMKTFVWLLPVTFMTSFITTASQMFEEAELEQYKKGEHVIDSNFRITAMKVFTKMLGEFVSDGMGHFGHGLIVFFAKFNDLGWFESTWKVPLACTVMILLVVIIFLCLTGGSIRLPLFMGGFYFHGAGNSRVSSSSERAFDESRTSTRVEENRPTSSITFNFNQPTNMQDIFPTISQYVSLPRSTIPPPVPSSSPLPAIASNPTGGAQDSMAGGDGPQVALPNQDRNNEAVFSFQAQNRHDETGIQRRISKHFHHLQARYKAGHKLANNTKRERHKSL